MRRPNLSLIFLTLIPACTALNQKDAFLDAETAKRPAILFSDDFENGLGKWTQSAGTWTTAAAGVTGVALLSPTSLGAANFSIGTVDSLDLIGKSNCLLEYDIRFLIKGVSGASATVLFNSTVIGNFKDTSGLTDMTSAGSFVHRRALLPNNGVGRVFFATSVTNATTGYADLRIDNVVVSCNNAPSTNLTVVDDNLNSSAANWTLTGPYWLWVASGGSGDSAAIRFSTASTQAGNLLATYVPTLNLTNRHSCILSFYYVETTNHAPNCLSAEWNGSQVWSLCGAAAAAGNITTYLTAFEGISTNTLAFRCNDTSGTNPQNINCLIDEVKLTCQE